MLLNVYMFVGVVSMVLHVWLYCEHFTCFRFKELRDTTNFFLKNTYKSLQDLFSGSHYIETKKMASLIFLIFKYFGAGGGNN